MGFSQAKCRMSVKANHKLTSAVSIVADPYGATQKASSPTQVAGTDVSNVVIAADALVGDHWHRAWRGATHDTMGAVGLVRHAGLRTRTYYL